MATKFTQSANMQTRDGKCPRCKVNYKLTDMTHHLRHKREPLLLLCGHAVCEACMGGTIHTCVLCQQVTSLDKRQPQGKHLYILGGLYCNRKKGDFMMNTFHQPQMFPQPKMIRKDQCQECCQKKASVLCTTCTSQLCEACFKKIHLPRTMKAHKSEPLPEGGPWMLSKCQDHPREVCSLLCHTCSSADSEKYICTRCHILGSHQQHEVIELAYLNSLKMPQVQDALNQMEQTLGDLQSQRNRCLALLTTVREAEQTAVGETQALAHHLHGLLQLREEQTIHSLHLEATSLHCDLAAKGAQLEGEITERLELLREARAALTIEETACHAGRLLGELRKVLGGTVKSDAGGEERQKKEEQEDADEEEEETARAETIDELARRICTSFDVTSTLKSFSEQLSAPSVSQFIPSINKDALASSLSRSPEEAISDGRLTPAHLQLLSDPHDLVPKLQRSPKLPEDTFGASSFPLVPERDHSPILKPQKHYSLPLELMRDGALPQEHSRNLSLPLELPERDSALPPEHLKDFSLPFKGRKGAFEKSACNTAAAHTQGRHRDNFRGRKVFIPDPFQALLLDNDPGISLRGNRTNRSNRARRRNQGSVDRFSVPFKPFLPAADSPVPSDVSDDTAQMDVSEDSSTKDGTQGCTTEEDVPQEKLTPDIIKFLDGWRGKKAAPKTSTSTTTTKQPDFTFTAAPPPPPPLPLTASSKQTDFDFLKKPPPPLPKATAESSFAVDINFIKTVPPPAPFSSMGNRTFSTSSLQSNASSKSSVVPSKMPLCFIDEEVEVTHIQSPSFFYVHTQDNIQKRQTLSNKLHRFASKGKPLTTKPPNEGDTCLGQFTEDRKWYRVEVKTVMKEEGAALVTYIDYGNKEVLPFTRLRSCPPKFRLENQPSLAIACSLWEVEPARGKDWDTEAIHIFAKLVKDATLQLLLISYETVDNITKCQVELRRPWRTVGISNDLPVSIREILVFLEYAVYTNKSPEDMYNKKREESFKRNYFLPEIPFCENDTEVLLSSVTSPHNFSLQIKSSSDHLNTLLTDLDKNYGSPNIKNCLEWNIYSPKIDMPCVAQYTRDMRWQRARVENLPGHQMVDIKFVDFGNVERLWYHQLYKIMDEFLVLPIQAVPCKLVGITPLGGTWREEDTQRMIDLCDVRQLKAVFLTCDGDVCSVRLAVPGDTEEEDLDVGQLLVEDGRALPMGPYMSTSNMHSYALQRARKTRDHKETAESDPSSMLSTQQHCLAMYRGTERRAVAHLKVLESFVYLHLLLQENAEACRMYQEQLAKVYEQEASEGGFLAGVGDDCLVEMSSGQLTRATVLSVTEQQMEVFLIDCGGIEKVSACSVYPMPAGMGRDTVAPFWQVVSLDGVLPPAGLVIWPGITLDYLRRQFVSSKKFSIIPKGEPMWDVILQVKVLPVDLGCQREVKGGPMEANKIIWVSINKQLLSNGLALPARPSPKKLTQEGSPDAYWSLASTSSATKEDESTTHQTEEGALLPQVKEQDSFHHGNSEDELNPDSEAETIGSIIHSPSTTVLIPKKWLPPEIPTTLTFTATPSYVDDQGHIFLQPKINAATIDFIRESQTLMFNGTSPGDEDLCWRPGDPVVAKFHLDKKWYRATVLELKSNGKVKVTFVDYGNPESVRVQEIRTRLLHTEIPIQCYKSRLINVVPANEDGQWKEQVLDFMHLTLVDKECLVTIVEEPKDGESLKVNLKLRSVGVDVATFLVDDLGACRRLCQPLGEKKEEEEEEESSHDVIIESEESEEPLRATLPSPPPPPLSLLPLSLPTMSSTPQLVLPPGEMFSVQVTAIQDPAHVFITPITSQERTTSSSSSSSSLHRTWAAQNSDLEDFLNCINRKPQCLRVVSQPKVGEVYLARFSENLWVRAEVVGLDMTSASLVYIDFGHTETVPRENIRECPLEGQRIGRCARLVRLSSVEPPGEPGALWEAEAMEAMIECLMGPQKQRFLASVVEVGTGGMAEVDIYKMASARPLTLAYSEPVKRGIITLRERK